MLQKTNLQPPRVDLLKEEFDRLIDQKGKDVLLEKALLCPCKSRSTNQLSDCKNCGGTGWLFINPLKTRMILHSINIVTDFKPWSEEMRGTVNVTCKAEEELSNMDKITDLNGEAIFNEVLFFKKKGDNIFCYTTYNVKKVLYIGMHTSTSTPLLRLIKDVDYTVNKNIILLIKPSIIEEGISIEDVSFTIRYKHAPEFHVIEMKRETMQTFEYRGGGEKIQNMPISAIARRAHYQLQATNLLGDRLIDNSYTE